MPLDRMLRAHAPDHSPCVGHCTADENMFCLSCRRSKAEVDAWKTLSEGDRLATWDRLPGAIDSVGRNLMRLPLTTEDIGQIAGEILDEGGSWLAGFGQHWFRADTRVDDTAATSTSGDDITIRLDLAGKVRALAWARDGQKLADGVQSLPLVLVIPAVRLTFPVHDAPAMLDDGQRDLGLGLASVRLLEEGGHCAIETPLARIEGAGVTADLAQSGAAATPDGLELNKNYAFGVILMPASYS